MSWIPFLRSKDFDPTLFEKQLATLSKKINLTDRKITRLNSQRQRIGQIAVINGSISYFVLIIAIWTKAYIQSTSLGLVQWGVIIGLPVVVLILWKLYNVLNLAQINRNTQYLEILKEEHNLKIEELKEKTKYGQTAALLNRFSEGKDAEAIVDEEIERKQLLIKELDSIAKKHEQDQLLAKKQSKSWIDSVVDTIVGGGTSGAAGDALSPNNRYALICQVCHNHNGLAPPGVLPNKVRYQCPRCQQPNGDPLTISSTTTGSESDSIEIKTTTPEVTKVESEKTPVPITKPTSIE